MGSSSIPEVLLFQRFRGHWISIAPDRYEDAFSDEFVKLELTAVCDEVISFCKQQVCDQQPRDDYKEFLTLTMIFLDSNIPSSEAKFRALGPMHQADGFQKPYTV